MCAVKFILTNGADPDFVVLCRLLDEELNVLAGGEQKRAVYMPYNALSEIHDVILAYRGNLPIGCASLRRYTGDTAEVKRVFVRKTERGAGIGRRLMGRLEQHALKLGYTKLLLESGEPLAEAMRLYRSLGYKEIPNYGPYVNMPDSICMEKELTEAARPVLDHNLDGNTFRNFYYLKEELTDFCRKNGLPVSGGKPELTERIARFLDSGEILQPQKKRRAAPETDAITEDSLIGRDFVCSEKHRQFFVEKIGKHFAFHVPFMKWLKNNPDKTYAQAVEAYRQIMQEKKTAKTVIDRQFEYNTYIRDFFADNKGKTLHDAIQCWKYKKSLPGHNRYERTDLIVLQSGENDNQ